MSKDLMVGRSEVGRYLERRKGEGSALVGDTREIPSVVYENGGQRSLFSGRSKPFMEVEDSA